MKLNINNYGLENTEYHLTLKGIKKVMILTENKAYRQELKKWDLKTLNALIYGLISKFNKKKRFWYYFLTKTLF